MTNNADYPSGTAEWKKSAVDWLYENGFLTAAYWKEKIDEPLPLWAQAAIYQRLYLKLKEGE